jgi:hypothetical protein
MCLTLRFSLV